MFFWNKIILIGVIDESSHHFSFDTHLNQDDRRAITQQFVNRPYKELCESSELSEI
jgi:hypothetical protein